VKLAYISLCGFRGYRKPVRIEFSESFTILDGRNGVGKSTIFDAVEFALTGTLDKYSDAKADGETVADYIWWNGGSPTPDAHYVEVGFEDVDGIVTLRRTRLEAPSEGDLEALTFRLCDRATMPKSPLNQLCASSIIRDEHISAMSLDLSEAERYARLREALGATDAGDWLDRGSKLLSAARKRVQAAAVEADAANKDAASATKRIDEVRASLQDEAVLSAAAGRLRALVGTAVPLDRLAEPVREWMAATAGALRGLSDLAQARDHIAHLRRGLPSIEAAVADAAVDVARAETEFARQAERPPSPIGSSSLEQRAAALVALISAGRAVGRQDGCCPLCGTTHSEESFTTGMDDAAVRAQGLSRDAAVAAEQEQGLARAGTALAAARAKLAEQRKLLEEARHAIAEYAQRAAAVGLLAAADMTTIRARQAEVSQTLTAAESDLRIIDTLRLNEALVRATAAKTTADTAYADAERRLGLARKAERHAQALHDAARRAAGETLDRRLEQALPLITELYQRLRPHPVWATIGYKLRGDVRKFLRLHVGDELNPQFLFSSGQRRATGLAFLLAVNLSLAWSRWRTILLDDPVQHVDDFRSIHLAEVMAQLTASGRQIICAVEDAALADLLCRRLPAPAGARGRRITLGTDADGALAKQRDELLPPLPQLALLPPASKTAGQSQPS